MTFTMMSAATVFLYSLMPKLSGFTIQQLQTLNEHSPAKLIRTSIIVQGLGSIFVFLLPSLLFAYLSHPAPAKYLGLKAPGKNIQFILAILIMIGAMPVLSWIAELIGHIDFGAKVKAEQAVNDNMMKAYLRIPDAFSLMRVLVVMAIIPAVGEELFFRGVLMRMARKRSRTMLMPILFTAAVFAYAHTNIYGYLSIFLAGIILAVIYDLTGSIWCSIAAHLFFNGSQVVLAFLGNSNSSIKQTTTGSSVSLYLVAGGLALFCASFYLLLKNKTPLPDNWANDFDAKDTPYTEVE
jgi:membrane protease YdiL (CAAX protease family)